MRRALVATLAVFSLAGCAGLQTADTRSAERTLTAAGFEARPADTAEKLAHLQSLPARTLVRHTQDGATRYVYADPASCKCLYVGGDAEYRRLRRHEDAVVKKFFSVEDSASAPDFGLWEIGPR